MSNNTTEDEEERSTIVVIQVSREQTDLVVPLFIACCGLYGKTVSVEEARSYLEEGLAQGDSLILLAVQQFSPVQEVIGVRSALCKCIPPALPLS
jgi:hypothetical protein